MLAFPNISARFGKRFSINSPKPQSLSIQRDNGGVPHVKAKNLNDASWGMGYCHAMDRSSQLIMMRILGQGRLCELLEDTEENLAIDLFFRRVNWQDESDKQLSAIDEKTREWCQAYCDGVNAGFSDQHLAIFKLLGYTPEPWTIKDSLLIMRMSGYLTLAQSQGEIEKFFIQMLQADIDLDKLQELFPFDATSIDLELIKKVNLEDPIVPFETLWAKSIPRVMASNNWVVAGNKTAAGFAMMANDPHLEVNRLPNVWYEIAIRTDDHQSCGFSMPGLPSVLIGRTPNLAWGATYTFMDTVDSWIEQCKEGKHKRGKTWRAFKQRKEIIKRKKHSDHETTFYENKHGVLSGNPYEEGYYLTTSWSPALGGAQSLNASFEMLQANNVKDAMTSLGKIESAWNWVISDSENNIGYQMSGLMPKRKEGWNGFTPAPGWDASYDWQGFHAPKDLPHEYNPECGYIVTANQDLNHFGKLDPINMPMGDYRARRIESKLQSTSKHTIDSMRKIQMDTYSLQAEQFLTVLLPLLVKNGRMCETANVLDNWDRCYKESSIGAPLFETFYSCLRMEVFSPDQLGPDVVNHLAQQTGIFIDFYQNFDHCLLNPKSAWYEHIDQEHAFLAAFDQARQLNQGLTWGELNRFKFTNQLFQGKLPSVLGFDSPELCLIGGRATPHQGQIYSSAGRETSFAPSVRLVANMGTSELLTSIAGGPSDKRLSRWYMSGVDDWLKGNFKTLVP